MFSIFLVAVITVAFGGIHCIGWSFAFPSSTEKTLWRVASLSITCVPVAYVPFGRFGVVIDEMLELDNYGLDEFCMNGTTITLFYLYMFSRLVLLVLPFLSLRSLPPAAFHVVHWTSFIPHV